MSSADVIHWPTSAVQTVGKNQSFVERDMENIVVGRWMELSSSLKAATLWGIFNNRHCNGAVMNHSYIFLAFVAKWHISSTSAEFNIRSRTDSDFRNKLIVHHTQVEKRGQHDLLLGFCDLQLFILWWCVGVHFWGVTFCLGGGLLAETLSVISINSLW